MMDQTAFAQLQAIIHSRRTIKPTAMNGKLIPDADIKQILELADWAPTHGRTEPWRFKVYAGEAARQFGPWHAEMYKNSVVETEFDPGRFEKLSQQTEKVSHVVLAWMKRGSNPKIPILEEIASTAAAIEHVLLGAQALGIAAMWNSGGMTYHPTLKQELGLQADDQVMGILYLGYTNEEPKPGKRTTHEDERVLWVNNL